MFKQLAKNNKIDNEMLFLGSPEAEAEALPNSQIPLSLVYDDYSNLVAELQYEKFIILGRKGSGKSAFAEYICSIASTEPNMFAKFIRKSETNLESIVQIGKDNGHKIEIENLYTWLILTNVLKLFSENQAVQDNKYYNDLNKFLSKNSGFIDIHESEIKEVIEQKGMEVHTEFLKRFFSAKMDRKFDIKQEKASFYKLIPHLKEVLLNVLKSDLEVKNKNSYVLFFDDLDIISDIKDEGTQNSLLSLLRVSKEINNEFFAKNNLDSKVVLLLRDDISKYLASLASDSSKLFSSYSTRINWYQDEYHQNDDEVSLNIRKFINKRIEYAFNQKNISVNKVDPWKSLVEDPFAGSMDFRKSSFKYVLDHTFFRPRDLLLFFYPLSKYSYKFPLNKHDINSLIGKYCAEVMKELKNELSCFYSQNQIGMIFNAIIEINNTSKILQENNISYNECLNIIDKNCVGINASDLLEDMFNRGLIGNINSNSHFFFKYREPSHHTYNFNRENGVILHNSLRIYCENTSST